MDIAGILTGTLQPEELYTAIYEQSSRVLETTGFYVSLYEPGTDVATVVFFADRGRIEHVRITYRGSDSCAIREGRPIHETLTEPDHAVLLLGETNAGVTRSGISAPMIREGNTLGVLSAQSYNADAYGDDDLQLLTALADLAAVAIDNARYVQETERRRREAERLEEIGRALTASLELSEVLRRVTGSVIDLAAADSALVWLLRGDDTLEIAMSAGVDALPVGRTYPVPPTVRSRIVQQRKYLAVADIQSDPLVPEELRESGGFTSMLSVPLIAEDRVIGALSAGHVLGREYAREDIRLLERLGYQAAIAVENARLHEQIRLLSLTDPLTELPNRRHMEMVLAKEFAAARRGRRLAIVLFDLDYFKIYNDREGHQAGDEALRIFAELLAAETRTMNLAARYGGDEFISILSDSDLEGARMHAERLQAAVDRHPVLGAIGVSAGVAGYTPEMEHPDDLIRAADHDLYRRKGDRVK